MSADPDARPRTAGELARGLDDAFSATPTPALRQVPTASTRAMPATGIPLQRDERVRHESVASPRLAPHRRPTVRRPLPGWIPLAGVILALLVAVGAIAALVSGGSDKATAPVAATTHKASKPKTPESQP